MVTYYEFDPTTNKWVAAGTVDDSQYEIHGGGYTKTGSYSPMGKNRYQDNTWGCIRGPNGELIPLGEFLKKAFDDHVPITVTAHRDDP